MSKLKEIKKRRDEFDLEIEHNKDSAWPGGVYDWDFIRDIDYLISRVEKLEEALKKAARCLNEEENYADYEDEG